MDNLEDKKERGVVEDPEENTQDVPEENPDTSEKLKTDHRSDFYNAIRERFPNEEIDDDAVYDKALNVISELSDYKTSRSEIDKKLAEQFELTPEAGVLFAELAKGEKPFRAILAEMFDPEDFEAKEGDEDFDAINDSKEARAKRLKDQKEKQAKIEENLSNAEKALDAFAKENGYSDEQTGEFMGKIESVLSDMADGVLTPETLLLFKKGLNYDKDTKEVAEVAELKGRNANIQEKKADAVPGDGLPDTSKSAGVQKEIQRPKSHEHIDRMLGGKTSVI